MSKPCNSGHHITTTMKIVKCISVGDYPTQLTKQKFYEVIKESQYNKVKQYLIINDNGLKVSYPVELFEEVE